MALLCFCGVFLFSCAPINEPYQETRVLLGTYVTVKINNKDLPSAARQKAADKAFAEIKRLEELLSSFKEGNIIDKINTSGSKEVFLDEDTFYILEKAKYFYEASGGAFDVTVKPLLELWGFHKKMYAIPRQEEIDETLKRTGSDKMILNKEKRSVRFLIEGMKVDLGGIAKGYAVDKTVVVLKENGIENALVAAAGDIYCMGRKSENEKWMVGIRNPVHKNKIIEKVDLEDMAISTSGGYENFFEIKGKRYSHIINPKTGWPVENDLLSVTIISKDSLTADALATTVFVLGKYKDLELLKKFPDAQAKVIISSDLNWNLRKCSSAK